MNEDAIIAAAAQWHARIDQESMDWAAFADWLDADPANRAAYDRIAMLDAEITDAAPQIAPLLPANDVDEVVVPPPARRFRWFGGAVAAGAAALAVALAWPMLQPGPVAPTVYETAANGRTVSLPDGSSLHLDRGTRVEVAADGRNVTIASGAAVLDVRHDAARPLTVTAGDYRVQDVGTRFEVVRTGNRFSVAVVEGEVAVSAPGVASTPVHAGQRFDVVGSPSSAVVRGADASAIGAWRDGRLIYDNAPLALVASDVGRYGRMTVTVDPRLADLRLSGVLTIGDGSNLVAQVEAILPVAARREGQGVRLVPAARP